MYFTDNTCTYVMFDYLAIILPCGCVICVFVLGGFLSPTRIGSRPSFPLFHLHLYIHTPQIAGYLYKNIQRLDHRVTLFTEYNAFYNIVLNFRSFIFYAAGIHGEIHLPLSKYIPENSAFIGLRPFQKTNNNTKQVKTRGNGKLNKIFIFKDNTFLQFEIDITYANVASPSSVYF